MPLSVSSSCPAEPLAPRATSQATQPTLYDVDFESFWSLYQEHANLSADLVKAWDRMDEDSVQSLELAIAHLFREHPWLENAISQYDNHTDSGY